MLYQLDDVRKEVSIQNIIDSHLYFGIMDITELEHVYQDYYIEKSSIERCKHLNALQQNSIIPHREYFFGIMSLVNSKNVFLKKDIFSFFIFKNLFLICVVEDEDKHIYNVFQEICHHIEKSHLTIARLIYYFMNGLIVNDYQYIERLQEDIDDLENYNTQDESVVFTNKLRSINKELLLLRNYYENLVGIGEELQMDYHHFFDKEDLRYMEIFVQRVTRLSDNIALLQELSAQSREVHQSKLDYSMNRTMQFFTVVTTIFMPLTLVAGWYGMNFKYMPELDYKYSYFIVMILSVGIVLICIYWFKKKKFF